MTLTSRTENPSKIEITITPNEVIYWLMRNPFKNLSKGNSTIIKLSITEG